MDKVGMSFYHFAINQKIPVVAQFFVWSANEMSSCEWEVPPWEFFKLRGCGSCVSYNFDFVCAFSEKGSWTKSSGQMGFFLLRIMLCGTQIWYPVYNNTHFNISLW